MRIAIIDDMKSIHQELTEILNDFATGYHQIFEIDTFDSGEAFLSHFQAHTYDLIFLDIYMGGMDGTEVAWKLREKDSQVALIFLTTSMDHMGKAFSTHAFDYIAKPIHREEIELTMCDIMRTLPQPDPYLKFTCENVEHKIFYSDLACLYANGHYTQVLLTSGKIYRPYMTFISLAEPLLKDPRFLMVSRGVLCNMDEIEDLSAAGCTLAGGTTVPVTKRNVRSLAQQWNDYEFARIHRQAKERGLR